MSAIEYLLANHVPSDESRALALASGVNPQQVEEQYGLARAPGWVAEYVDRVGIEAAWSETRERLRWGRHALYDFPIAEEISIARLRTALRTVGVARGDVFAAQAVRDLQTEPQVALVRQLNQQIIVVVADEGVHEFLPKLTIGMESRLTPKWTFCALSRRAGSWRLEVYGDFGQSQRVAEAVAAQIGASFVLAAPFSLRLDLAQIEELADEFGALIKVRSVIPHQDQTGLRKIEAEAGSAIDDIRNASFYAEQVTGVTDQLDYDVLHIPLNGTEYTLRISRHGSFWFRAFTPRGLIDDVLRCAERLAGV